MWRKLKVIAIGTFLIQFSRLLLNDLSSYGYKNSDLPTSLSKSKRSRPAGHQNSSVRQPLVLIFNKWARSYNLAYKWVNGTETSSLYLPGCPHRCRFTLDRDQDEDKADMVMFNTFYDRGLAAKLNRQSILGNQEKVGQIWTGVTTESPYYHGVRGKKVDDVFHWIATYRRDADIFWPYWSYVQHTDSLETVPQKTKSKKKLVAWLVSRCSSQSKRELIVKALQRYIPVDIYGKCGKPCPQGLNCRAYLAANYKFYLAFENSLCLDYVTEKLFLMLKQSEPIVPVTYSWINDTTLAPPSSYIDTRDFKSIKDLADYLKYLDSNDDEYNNFLEWRTVYKIVENANDAKLCRACEMLLKYKERLGGGGKRMKRQPSMLQRINSLGAGVNFSYFKVAGNLVQTNTVCFSPLKNEASRNWLVGAR